MRIGEWIARDLSCGFGGSVFDELYGEYGFSGDLVSAVILSSMYDKMEESNGFCNRGKYDAVEDAEFFGFDDSC